MKVYHYVIAFLVAPFIVSFFTHDSTIGGLSVLVTLIFFWVTTRKNKDQVGSEKTQQDSMEKKETDWTKGKHSG